MCIRRFVCLLVSHPCCIVCVPPSKICVHLLGRPVLRGDGGHSSQCIGPYLWRRRSPPKQQAVRSRQDAPEKVDAIDMVESSAYKLVECVDVAAYWSSGGGRDDRRMSPCRVTEVAAAVPMRFADINLYFHHSKLCERHHRGEGRPAPDQGAPHTGACESVARGQRTKLDSTWRSESHRSSGGSWDGNCKCETTGRNTGRLDCQTATSYMYEDYPTSHHPTR